MNAQLKLDLEALPRVNAHPGLAGYVSRFPQIRILAIGDIMLDCYLNGSVKRISPEAPVPVLEIEEQTWMPGGMANACVNAAALGASALPIGVVGRDESGQRLIDALREKGVAQTVLIQDAGRPTTTKNRIVSGSHQIVRLDAESRAPISAFIEDGIIQAVREHVSQTAIVLVCDYAKGLLTPKVLAETFAAANAARVPVFVDPKRKEFADYRGATVIKSNLKETAEYSGITIDSGRSLLQAATKLRDIARCDHVVVTLGAQGMLLVGGSPAPLYVPGRVRQVFDVGGAGDTAMATLALAVAAGASIADAMYVANAAAGLVVQKRGTASISRAELISELNTQTAGHGPETESYSAG